MEVLYEFQREEEATEEEVNAQYQKCKAALENLEFRSTLTEDEDELDCVLEINSGAGGTESCDWVAMLMRMYEMWANKAGHEVKILSLQPDDVAGYRSVALEMKGAFIYGFLKGEMVSSNAKPLTELTTNDSVFME